MHIIRLNVAQPLREDLARSPDKLMASAFPELLWKTEVTQGSLNPSSFLVGGESPDIPTFSEISDGYFRGLALVKTLVKHMPGWLRSNRSVFDILVSLWKSRARTSRLQKEQELNLMQVSKLALYHTVGTFMNHLEKLGPVHSFCLFWKQKQTEA